ncbi:MAG: aldo/keto reductase [Armatimonadetes bacterium]|nr:aldo/keto reductase [Armatimonadota bacterium]
MLPRRTLGRTGLEVTQLGFRAQDARAQQHSNGQAVSDEQAQALLNAVVDSGINLIDTGCDSPGIERQIGQAISSRRAEYYLAARCNAEASSAQKSSGFLDRLGESLKAMNTDHLDILQLQGANPARIESDGLLQAMTQAREQGLTRFLGVSTRLAHVSAFVKMGVFDTFQLTYSALERREEESITLVSNSGAGVIVFSDVAREVPSHVVHRSSPWDIWVSAGLDRLLDAGQTRMEFLLRFALSHPDCDTLLVDPAQPRHLEEDVAAARKGPLPEDVYEEAKRRLTGIGIASRRVPLPQ